MASKLFQRTTGNGHEAANQLLQCKRGGQGPGQEGHPWVIPGECAKRTPKELSTQTVGGDSEQSHPEEERIQRIGMFSPITS